MFSQTSLRRRLFALVVAVALVGVILPVAPAAAATEACPSAIPSAAYRDLGGLSKEAVEAINCITYYGIAEGISTTRFDPYGPVPRWQMALFLVRAAEDIGITLPSGVDQGFTDLGGLTTQTRTAVNQLAQLGITKGVNARMFAPFDPVPRWQMALFLTRLYSRAGYSLPSGTAQGFTDIGDMSREGWYAINQLAQLGVTKGVSRFAFGPYGLVYRWQMALFLARELQACHVRPLNVSISPSSSSSPTSEPVQLTIRVTEPDGSGVANTYVDVFVGSLDSSKRCVLESDSSLNGGDAGTGSNCKIDSSDPKTNSSGYATVTLTHLDQEPEVETIYAWVGDAGQTFDADEVLFYGTSKVQWTVPIGDLSLGDVTARYGTKVDVRARLLSTFGDPVPAAGQRVVFKVSRDQTQIISQTITTSSDGVATLTYVGPSDPSSGDDPVETDLVTAFWDKDGDGVRDGNAEFQDTSTVTWDDAEPRSDVVTFSQSTTSSLLGGSYTLTVKVTDKFGVGYPNALVTFIGTGANAFTKVDDTDGNGIAQVTSKQSVGGIDVIGATVDLDADKVIEPEDFDESEIVHLTHYTVQTAPSLVDGIHTFDVLGVDPSANAVDVVEIGTGNLYRLLYDSTNDLFGVDGVGKTLDQFEIALGKLSLPALDGSGGVALATNTYTTSTSGSSTFILTTH